jgi:ribonucleoside-diphosphate reductase alpha chain
LRLNDNAERVLQSRYYLKNDKGEIIEDWKGLCLRVCNAVAKAEEPIDIDKWSKIFFEMMYNLDFLPNSPTLFNAGKEKGLLSACFTLDIEDNMLSIMKSVTDAALIFKHGGGVGLSFNSLRPEGDLIKTTGGTSSGPCSFMRMFDTMTEVVKQGGKRRGALLGLLNVEHPDIEKFISSKSQEGTLSNFNISVGISDDFMYKVKSKEPKELNLWNKIIDGAFNNGEPGILFMTTINAANPVPHMGKIKSSNPCGEFLFVPYGSCNLGSINLSNMFKDGEVNWEKLEKVTRTSVRFLDNVISVNWYPLPEIKDITTRTRPVGLGVMGFADLLLKLEVRYDSSEAIDYAQEIMEFIKEKSYNESVLIGKEKGSFSEFKKTKLAEKYETLRNCMLTVIAPTGSLSLIAGCSSGIEPNFSWHTEMHRIDTIMEEYHPLALKFLKSKEKLPHYFVTAGEISPEWHIRMQAAFQAYTDSAISKTVNMPNTATKEDVSKAYMLAWELKTKGITVYREGSRSKEVLVKGGKSASKKNQKLLNLVYRDRDIDLIGKTRKAKTGCGNSYITVNFDEDGYPIEVFKQVSSKGGCDAMAEGLARMTSLALRYGIDTTEIIKQLRSVKCSNAISKNVGCLSCPDLMGRVLADLTHKQSADNTNIKCPDCNTILETSEGCVKCKNCGYSKCG